MEKLANLFTRKFLFAVVIEIAVFVLFFYGKVSEDKLIELTQWIFAAFVIGNSVESMSKSVSGYIQSKKK